MAQTASPNPQYRLDPMDAEQLRHDLQTAAEVVLNNGLTSRGIGGAWVGKHAPVSIPGALNIAIFGDVQVTSTDECQIHRKNLAIDILDLANNGAPVTLWNADGKSTGPEAIDLLQRARRLVYDLIAID